ncbi:hypothetical protein [Mycoplasmopsis cynos]|uniref:Uncharacterized protein n=3 Tax=Mycoplasmopsis cynos TaxID=171284 RepID=L0RW60_MYCC1|nr:hypothetical protein [Mycoplasmopsis cynos]MCU9932567.1 hypothetical protein [Mycoplasmopsis cynos]TQC54640.1 hypothetical protein E1I74_02215 [Mycoplasmopsis cynos]UWV82191.1 hypothetical protein NW067_03945 [Mycoplasmopsis cynos]UWV86150.1 hypothetical protein NW063_05080 [Mycoplasmopsis cynos]WAM08532.1 hypothetical protein ONA03_03205 [Mycoplasmopsis cynos]
MKRQIKVKKIPFKTKLRFLFLGKYPIERIYKPKIIEYLFMIFSNILILIISIILFYVLLGVYKQSNSNNFYGNVSIELNKYEYRVILSVFLIAYLLNLILSVHVIYILNKTEFNKIFALIGVLTSIMILSPIAIIFLIIAYQKNELAFE